MMDATYKLVNEFGETFTTDNEEAAQDQKQSWEAMGLKVSMHVRRSRPASERTPYPEWRFRA